jgi:hypothetical protein
MRTNLCWLGSLLLTVGVMAEMKSDFPEARIANELVHANLYLPDPVKGFYRGTRFDWSGVVASLQYKGHDYYGPWFTATDPSVSDFVYRGADIVAGPCSAITGPVEEFTTNGSALGFAEAKAGGTFIKIGIGVLRKPDDAKYSSYRQYKLVDGGKWSVKNSPEAVSFTQELHDPDSGYAYEYHKTVKLVNGQPKLIIEHTLKNVGSKPIESSVYNHNFLVLDHQATGPDFVISFPFALKTDQPLEQDLAEVKGNKILYKRALQGEDRVFGRVEGYRDNPADNGFQIENTRVKAGLKIAGNRPLSRVNFWCIRSVIAVEPYIDMSIPPGGEFEWADRYEYYVQ